MSSNFWMFCFLHYLHILQHFNHEFSFTYVWIYRIAVSLLVTQSSWSSYRSKDWSVVKSTPDESLHPNVVQVFDSQLDFRSHSQLLYSIFRILLNLFLKKKWMMTFSMARLKKCVLMFLSRKTSLQLGRYFEIYAVE